MQTVDKLLIEPPREPELWLPVYYFGELYPLYEVSNHARVRRRDTGAAIALSLNSYKQHAQYLRVCLYRHQGGELESRSFYIHRLVAWHFCHEGRADAERKYVDHTHGRPHLRKYNESRFLQWVTPAQNAELARTRDYQRRLARIAKAREELESPF